MPLTKSGGNAANFGFLLQFDFELQKEPFYHRPRFYNEYGEFRDATNHHHCRMFPLRLPGRGMIVSGVIANILQMGAIGVHYIDFIVASAVG